MVAAILLVSIVALVPQSASADPDHRQKGKQAPSKEKGNATVISGQTVTIKAKGTVVERPGKWSTASDVTLDLKGSVQKREGNHSNLALSGTLDIGGDHYQIGAKGKLKLENKNRTLHLDGETQDGKLKIRGIITSVEDDGKLLKFVTGPVAKFEGHKRIYGLAGEVRLADAASSPAGQSKLTVKSADMAGKAITGMFVNLSRDGKQVAAGYTPFAFSVKSGTQYTVSVSDYQNKMFDHWEDGSTSRSRAVTLGTDTAITAYYRTGGISGPVLTVNAVGPDGSVRHMWMTIQSGSATVQSGYAPLAYQGVSGAAYTVSVSDYQDLVFDRWDNGSTDRARTVTLSSATTITAHFKQAAQSSGLDHFAITAIGEQEAGSGFTFQVTVFDGLGRIKTGFAGTVTLSSNDGTSPSGDGPVMPASYTFTPVDAGQHVFSVKMYNAKSGVRITVSGEGTSATSNAFSVLPAEAASVKVTPSAATIAPGGKVLFTAEAKDAYGNKVTDAAFAWGLEAPSLGSFSMSSDTSRATFTASTNVESRTSTEVTALSVHDGVFVLGSANVTVDPA